MGRWIAVCRHCFILCGLSCLWYDFYLFIYFFSDLDEYSDNGVNRVGIDALTDLDNFPQNKHAVYSVNFMLFL